jgi:hypothetical protein
VHDSTVLAFDFSGFIGDVASIATIAAALAGSIFALRYGRKANATVALAAQRLKTNAVVVSARISVQSSGFRSLEMNPNSSHLSCTEMVLHGNEVQAGSRKEVQTAVLDDNTIIVPGETVTTSREFFMDIPGDDVVGWQVHLAVDARRRLSRSGWTWEDTNYVAKPPPDKSSDSTRT